MLRAAAIAGDCVHNLRAALDYIVTELVRIAKADLLRQHQFPIFDDQGKFARTVGPDIRHLNARGPLVGITLGFDTIEQLQPYKRGNSAREDPLFLLHSLSNADKHRQILDWQLLVAKATGSVDFGVPVLKQTPGRVLPGLFANREQELLRVRFGGVPPTNYDLTAQVDAHLWFVCAPVKGEKRLLIPHSVLDSLCEHVSMVLDLFEKHVLSDPP
jgi:hypothetical protein